MQKSIERFVIIGGVAGGASAAARARRLSEHTQITIIERGPDVSFANCGLPYYIGGEITDRSKLALHTPESLKLLLNIDIRTLTEAIKIDRERKVVAIRSASGREKEIPYDKLLLSPGASPLKPPLPGIDDPRIMTLRTLQDMDAIKERMATASRVLVIGAGFIGIEMVEMLVRLKKQVTLVELQNQVMPQLDHEMAKPIEIELLNNGVELVLGDGIAGFSSTSEKVTAQLRSGKQIQANAVILSIGVKCESTLAEKAGLELGQRKSIRVNEFLQTSDPDIYAVGDAVETHDPILGKRIVVPLGGPANRQGRVVADHIFASDSGHPVSSYPGTIGTAIVRAFDVVAGVVGYTEARLIQEKVPHRFAIVTSHQHAGYYPGATPITLKILWSLDSGRLLGGQAIGGDGVDKRLDVLSTAITGKLTVDHLCHLELAYAPPFGAAKDVINIAGFTAQNIQNGLLEPVYDLNENQEKQILDVRPPESIAANPVPRAIAIPLEDLRSRLHELDKEKLVVTVCALGKTSYFAYRILAQNGFKASAFIGGWGLRSQKPVPNSVQQALSERNEGAIMQQGEKLPPLDLDTCGLSCPGPILKIKEALSKLCPGQKLVVRASDPGFAKDFPAYCQATGLQFIGIKKEKGIFTAEALSPIAKGGEQSLTTSPVKRNGATLVVFSCDLDKVLAAFIVANGAAAMGGAVTMFFTFWGLNALRSDGTTEITDKAFMDKMFCKMMPQGINELSLSRMHLAGIGTSMMKSRMKDKNLPNLAGLLEEARKAGIRLVACSMSMDAMGICEEELIKGVEIGGVADFLAACQQSSTNLFI